jgi:hypothetical protein
MVLAFNCSKGEEEMSKKFTEITYEEFVRNEKT